MLEQKKVGLVCTNPGTTELLHSGFISHRKPWHMIFRPIEPVSKKWADGERREILHSGRINWSLWLQRKKLGLTVWHAFQKTKPRGPPASTRQYLACTYSPHPCCNPELHLRQICTGIVFQLVKVHRKFHWLLALLLWGKTNNMTMRVHSWKFPHELNGWIVHCWDSNSHFRKMKKQELQMMISTVT